MCDMTETPPKGFRKGRSCKSCRCLVSDRGRASASGDYFCSKPGCRLQRDAERQQRLREQNAAHMAAWRDKRKLDPSMPQSPPPLSMGERMRRELERTGMTTEQIDRIVG